MISPLGGTPGASYDRIRMAYNLVAAPAERRARERGLRLLNALPGEGVLDVGAGTGRALLAIGSAVAPGGHACGLDLSAGMVALAHGRISSLGRHAHVLQGDARVLPYRASTFDAALMSFTLELFEAPDIALVLAEIKRVLRPEGRLAIVAMRAGARATALSEAYEWLHRHFPRVIDCRPIDVLSQLQLGGYLPTRTESMSLWGLPVAVVLAKPCASRESTPRERIAVSTAHAGPA